MVTQPDLPGLPAAAAGAMHEQTFNEALAAALRQRRLLWRGDPGSVLGERLRMLADAERERPDILVAPADIYPVIVEVEFGEPAIGDARAKLGRLVVGTNDRVRAAIAVGVPPAVRGWSVGQLKERLAELDGVELRLALLYAGPTGTDDGASVWPEVGYVSGNVNDLAAMCEYAAAPPLLVAATADAIAAQIHNLADYLYRSLPAGTGGRDCGGAGAAGRKAGAADGVLHLADFAAAAQPAGGQLAVIAGCRFAEHRPAAYRQLWYAGAVRFAVGMGQNPCGQLWRHI